MDYCLARVIEAHCKLQFSTYILIAVIICNLTKCATMFWTIWQQRELTFVTFGDATLVGWINPMSQL